ncbi:MAG: mannose-1-phosphate guanylyltransferase [Robiginitomaculum sp.]|nr:MAG: mannose-1-phosphate guanylyltransferase [Robiginitomaculum sp.]
MVLAAGRGTRMLPLTKTCPKALVNVDGRTLLAHQLDRLRDAGVGKAIVNVHHFSDHVRGQLAARKGAPEIEISDESDQLLETGGALVRARPLLGDAPFFAMNCDVIWAGVKTDPFAALQAKFDTVKKPAAVLLLARKTHALGLNTKGDFDLEPDGRLRRRGPDEAVPYYYAGTQILDPGLLDGEAERPFSANLIWDKAQVQGALYGVVLDGYWLHVGDPAALDDAEAYLAKSGA